MRVKKVLILMIVMLMAIGVAACSKKDQAPTGGSAGSKGKTKLVVGTSASYKPWAFQEKDVVKGFEIDVWHEIAKKNNYDLEIKLGQFSGLIGMLDANEIDTVAHQMSITPERLEKYNFSEPYAYSFYDFFIKDNSNYKKKEDLKGLRVGCWLGGNGEATLRQINNEHRLGLNIITYDGISLEEELNIGRLAAIWQGEIKTKTVIEENKLPIKQLNEKLVYEINAYPFRKDEAGHKLVTEVTKAIKEMRADGTLAKLSKKWFNIDTTQSQE